MTAPEQLLSLAERCEAATGPDRDLDQAIEETRPGVLPHPDKHRWPGDNWAYVIADEDHPTEEHGQAYPSPRYTASLDAAMTLVPESEVNNWSLLGGNKWQAEVEDELADAVTPALALCAAAIRAISASDRGPASGNRVRGTDVAPDESWP